MVWLSNKEMGFSTSLQGQASHEALLGRQDAEIKLLETMRRCLTTKVKSDREYAATISSLTLQGKKIERSEDLVGSLIAQVYIIIYLLFLSIIVFIRKFMSSTLFFYYYICYISELERYYGFDRSNS